MQVAFEVVNTNGGRLLAGAGAQGAGESLDIRELLFGVDCQAANSQT